MRKKTVVAIGVFDGVHLGHRKILESAVKIAKEMRAQAAAITFNPHPASVLTPENAPPSLISFKHRLRLMRSIGIKRCVVINFTKRFAKTAPESFVKNILVNKLNAGWVVIGEDFSFGRQRQAGCDFLKKEGKRFGFAVMPVKIVRYKGHPISSSLIRHCIRKGSLAFAKRLLGRPFTVLGTVVRGRRLGRELGFPTANINPHHEVVPPKGVYAVLVNAGGDRFGGVLNIGRRPTFYGRYREDEEPTIEVYIFNFSKRIYGKDIEVEFVRKIRSEKKFKGPETLKRQIKEDVQNAKEAVCNLI